MSHYTVPYKYGTSMCEFWGRSYFDFILVFLYFEGVFNKTIIPLALVGDDMIIANSALRASCTIYHLVQISSECELLVLQTVPLHFEVTITFLCFQTLMSVFLV